MAEATVQAVLRVRDEVGGARRVELLGERVVVGRSSSADVTLLGEGVSRRHLELVRDAAGRWTVRDLGSRNGTSVDGEAVDEVRLRPGQVIRVAQYELRVDGAEPHGATTLHRTSTIEDGGAVRVNTLLDVEPPHIDARHLTALQSFARSLIDEPSAPRRLGLLGALMIGPVMGGRHAAVLRVQTAQIDEPELIGEPFTTTGLPGGLHLSRTALRALVETGEPVLATDARSADAAGALALSLSPDTEADAIAVLACPLASGDEGMTVLYVVMPGDRGTGEWLALTSLVAEAHRQAEDAWKARVAAEAAARIEQDLERAREVQHSLLPTGLVDLSSDTSLDIALHFEPCLDVGGDYADVIRLPDGRLLFCLADVCGKGIQAALIASAVRTFVHATVAEAETFDLAELIHRLHRYLLASVPEWSFVTMVVLRVDPATGAAEAVSAGHLPILQLKADGKVHEVGAASQPPLGIDPASATAEPLQLDPGDVLAIYSDGLTEVVVDTKRWLGIEGLGAVLRDARPTPETSAADIADAVARKLAAVQITDEAGDDQTLLIVRRR